MRTRREQLVDDVTARLGRVCAHLAPADFAALVESIVESTMQHERRLAAWGTDWQPAH